MGRTYERLDDQVVRFIEAQQMFFVGSAPSEGGHVNVSPKGLDTFRVFDDHHVGYLDLTGSGAETIAHVRDNGRLTIMFCAFEGKPRIVRLQGLASVHQSGSAEFDRLALSFGDLRGARAVVMLDVERVADSCGYAVPRMDFVGPRDDLIRWTSRRTDDDLEGYRSEKNGVSIDGLPAWVS